MKHLLNRPSKAALVLSGTAVLVAWLACSGSDGNNASSTAADCAPEEVEACDCPEGGAIGTMTCTSTGEWEACDCGTTDDEIVFDKEGGVEVIEGAGGTSVTDRDDAGPLDGGDADVHLIPNPFPRAAPGLPCFSSEGTGECSHGIFDEALQCIRKTPEPVDLCDGLDRNCDGVTGPAPCKEQTACYIGTGVVGDDNYEQTVCWKSPTYYCAPVAAETACSSAEERLILDAAAFCCPTTYTDRLPSNICTWSDAEALWTCHARAG